MSVLLTNIDDVRGRIVELENKQVFNGTEWMDVIEELRFQNRPSAEADAIRRMQTARQNCDCEICQKVRLEHPGREMPRIDIAEIVAVETVMA